MVNKKIEIVNAAIACLFEAPEISEGAQRS
jgi:hypothetical protein